MNKYINILHEKINNIIEIHGVGFNEDNSIRVDYKVQPTQEQQTLVDNVLQGWSLEEAKLDKLQEIEDDWNKTLENGWTTPYGWKLGINIQDVALLNGAFALAKEASLMGINDPVSIIDTDGNAHDLNLQDLTVLMLQYGQARASLSKQDAARPEYIIGV